MHPHLDYIYPSLFGIVLDFSDPLPDSARTRSPGLLQYLGKRHTAVMIRAKDLNMGSLRAHILGLHSQNEKRPEVRIVRCPQWGHLKTNSLSEV